MVAALLSISPWMLGAASIRSQRNIGMLPDVVFLIHDRPFSPDEQQGLAVVHLLHLIGRHQLPGLPAGSWCCSCRCGHGICHRCWCQWWPFPEAPTHICGCFAHFPRYRELIAVAQDAFPLLFKQSLQLGDILRMMDTKTFRERMVARILSKSSGKLTLANSSIRKCTGMGSAPPYWLSAKSKSCWKIWV